MGCVFYDQHLNLSFQWKRQRQSQFLKKKYNELKSVSDDKNSISLYYSLMTGDKRYLSKESKQNFKDLGLMHLLTPSGLHLSSILIIFKVIPKQIQIYLLFIISLPFFMLEKYYSIKRVLIFKLTYFVLAKDLKNKSAIAFITTFCADIVLGNFKDSPLSFAYSFLFWGTILFHQGSFLKLNYKLFFNLVVTSFISSSPISMLSLLINSICSSLFTLVYPILSFNFWIPLFDSQTIFSLWIIRYFDKAIFFISEIFPTIIPNLVFVLFIYSLLLKKLKNLSPIILLLISFEIGSRPNLNFRNKKYILSPKLSNDCKWIFKEFYYDIKCKKKGPRKDP